MGTRTRRKKTKKKRSVRRQKPKKRLPAPAPEPTPSIIDTTLSEIMSGKFTSATDKHGSNGTLVRVTGLTVKNTNIEADGDTHITVTDGQVSVFITEITPVEKAAGLTDPTPGSVIEETGYVFYDAAHANDAWHGNTGWELHPVKSWKVAN